MDNGNDITEIIFTKQLTAWCPLGEQSYIASVTVEVLPDNEIPDYCELNKELEDINGKTLIIEALAAKVYLIAKAAFNNAPARVTIDVRESAHMPVVVVKGDLK